MAREWGLAQTHTTSTRSPQHRQTPALSSSANVVCFTDAAWQVETNITGCGWLLKDHGDVCLTQGTCSFNDTSSALVAEALAVRSALLNALELGISRICIKTDCQALVAIITSNHHPADLHGIIRDIEHLSSSFDCISFAFISRNLNCEADSLAKTALYSPSTN
ncbi:uncharacterized protein LOC108835083 [Raphanus sativus]|uniref:Uncharacterized protein LOC108835083 n=1 Tax=Raphanus sativus TaxID=3726 RepID=A0A6J0LUK6_RAPSA|nr:uncharacterized protein LOC108835083 [Raphanus sativus]